MSERGMEKMLQRAREMQEKQNRRLSQAVVEATAAEGRIHGKMNGHRALLSVRVDPALISLDQREMIENALVELVNDLVDQIDALLKEKFGIVDKMPSLSLEHIFGR